nr:brca1-associated ring domain protein 1 [Quercus suber]
MEAMHPVNEEPYEVSLDNHGCCDRPKTGRLLALNNAPNLFNGWNFYFTCGFVPGYEEELRDLVMTAGGTVLKSKEELVPQSCDGQAKLLVVYNLDPPQSCDGQPILNPKSLVTHGFWNQLLHASCSLFSADSICHQLFCCLISPGLLSAYQSYSKLSCI